MPNRNLELCMMDRSGGQGTRIAVVGCGYVGLVAAVCFAEIGHSVICVDNDAAKIRALQAGQIPIHEEHLAELLALQSSASLRFTTSIAEAVRASDAVFIAVGTPPLDNGHADLSFIEEVAAEISGAIDSYKVIVEKSTVPVYTSDWISKILRRNGVDPSAADVVSNPEFLREGTAVRDFLCPDRIIVGTCSDQAFRVMTSIYGPLLDGSYYRRRASADFLSHNPTAPPLVRTSPASAELIKHASNAFLALKISYVNTIASMCEIAGADVDEVAHGMGLDRRIGQQFLSAGLGYGGSCFPKDLKAFRSLGHEMGVDVALLREVERINERQIDGFMGKIRSIMWNLRNKKLAVLGLAFKGGTDDVRESPAIKLVRQLLAEGCEIVAFDPAAMTTARRVLPEEGISYVDNALDAMNDADALLVLTDWPEFREIDPQAMKVQLAQPIVFDARNLLDRELMMQRGFTYVSIGRPAVEECEEPVALRRRA
ncbi:UDP-glucose dehydrogenase family protein [Occallatibacter riparius]|uniref:UDP-glucose 6-dehydrogenase n=1 Tax=Occallatibacter riparius TaxID=1002689 RepID=A0A9J7BZ24_9BACT|nr:UDP-glucose/GDP-mannose dehydrogenase family protein [Occallatibacter riparius]UWZ86957.1 UDP-glucose/GDP-mannose dehydrogenase family protein [Occallatibacter riparius]